MSLASKIGYHLANKASHLLGGMSGVASTAASDGGSIPSHLAATYNVPKIFWKAGNGLDMVDGELVYKLKDGFQAIGEVAEVLYNGVHNLANHPTETLGTAVGLYALIGSAPFIAKQISKVRKKSSRP